MTLEWQGSMGMNGRWFYRWGCGTGIRRPGTGSGGRCGSCAFCRSRCVRRRRATGRCVMTPSSGRPTAPWRRCAAACPPFCTRGTAGSSAHWAIDIGPMTLGQICMSSLTYCVHLIMQMGGSVVKWKENCSEMAPELNWICSLKLKLHSNPLKLKWCCLEIASKLLWNCSEIALKLLWNCSKTVLKLRKKSGKETEPRNPKIALT